MITIGAIVFTDLLTGVAIGMAVGVFLILRANAKTRFFMTLRGEPGGGRPSARIGLGDNVSFLNKAGVPRHRGRKPIVVVPSARRCEVPAPR